MLRGNGKRKMGAVQLPELAIDETLIEYSENDRWRERWRRPRADPLHGGGAVLVRSGFGVSFWIALVWSMTASTRID